MVHHNGALGINVEARGMAVGIQVDAGQILLSSFASPADARELAALLLREAEKAEQAQAAAVDGGS